MYYIPILFYIVLLGLSIFMLTNVPESAVYKYDVNRELMDIQQINDEISAKYAWVFYTNLCLFVVLVFTALIIIGNLYKIRLFGNQVMVNLIRFVSPVVILILSIILGVFGVLLGIIDTDTLTENFASYRRRRNNMNINVSGDLLMKKNYVPAIPMIMGVLGIMYAVSHFRYY